MWACDCGCVIVAVWLWLWACGCGCRSQHCSHGGGCLVLLWLAHTGSCVLGAACRGCARPQAAAAAKPLGFAGVERQVERQGRSELDPSDEVRGHALVVCWLCPLYPWSHPPQPLLQEQAELQARGRGSQRWQVLDQLGGLLPELRGHVRCDVWAWCGSGGRGITLTRACTTVTSAASSRLCPTVPGTSTCLVLPLT